MVVGSVTSSNRQGVQLWLGTPRSSLGVRKERLEGGEDIASVQFLVLRVVCDAFVPLEDGRAGLATEENLDNWHGFAMYLSFRSECTPTVTRVTLLQQLEELLCLNFSADLFG